ncbi:hypothetical protein B296_00050905 [Ensete ventricosum]|uniref:Uncharacterized protein n=1 Tax=Ensete ventricosum TaxID=4639 RepID=A0A426YJ71_ENSVE|nr:hypothetical protein B296_00050905 [Ensete ventricosum]
MAVDFDGHASLAEKEGVGIARRGGSRGGKWGDGMVAAARHGVARDSDAAGEVGCGREGRWWPKERAAVVADEGYGYDCNCWSRG